MQYEFECLRSENITTGAKSNEPPFCKKKCKTNLNFTATVSVDTSYLAVSLNFISICICIQIYLSYFLGIFVLKTTSVQRRVVLEVSGQSCKGSSSAASTIVGKMSTNSTLNMGDCDDNSDDADQYGDVDW